uniref:(northern house mosquito) hypothetical protein n=1 Tax=Culex pipiens TaxID=7175 RepID=A0A8D8IPI5_CULPI
MHQSSAQRLAKTSVQFDSRNSLFNSDKLLRTKNLSRKMSDVVGIFAGIGKKTVKTVAKTTVAATEVAVGSTAAVAGFASNCARTAGNVTTKGTTEVADQVIAPGVEASAEVASSAVDRTVDVVEDLIKF